MRHPHNGTPELQALGWSQELLAEKVGLHRTYVSVVERGEKNLSIDNIAELDSEIRRDDLNASELLREQIERFAGGDIAGSPSFN